MGRLVSAMVVDVEVIVAVFVDGSEGVASAGEVGW